MLHCPTVYPVLQSVLVSKEMQFCHSHVGGEVTLKCYSGLLEKYLKVILKGYTWLRGEF